MPTRPALFLGLLLAAAPPCGAAQPDAAAQEPQRLTGAFVTMTKGARCPATATIAFSAQGEATGPISGIFDMRGTIDVVVTAPGAAPAIRAFTADLDFNQRRVLGSLRWDPADPPLRISCDPLVLRIDGAVRYTVDGVGRGTLEIQAHGARTAVTAPYYGRTTMTFRQPALP
ncbi:MAG: hypothetical protein AB7I25_07350 [Vicinamibacterales bacterium]